MRRRCLLLLGLILLSALVFRAGLFYATVHEVGPDGKELKAYGMIHSDSREYIHLGEQIYRFGRYFNPSSAMSQHRALVRPPGFPLIYPIPRLLGYDSRQVEAIGASPPTCW